MKSKLVLFYFIAFAFALPVAYAQVTDTNARWTWISGVTSNNNRGSGVLGVESASYSPPAKREHAGWVDTAGNIWIFGGEFNTGANCMNDLWRFNTTNQQWMWVKGPFSTSSDGGFQQGGSYGGKGVTINANQPGGRRGATYWTDSAGKFWMFGGRGYVVNGSQGYLNDLWKYDPAVNMWTWVSGDNAINSNGEYGIQGTGTSTTRPRGRMEACNWVDKTGKIWFFGGLGNISGSQGAGRLNDLWRYDPVTGIWTWVQGSNDTNVAGNYGTKGMAAASNYPGARSGAAFWTGKDGVFWLFGGYGPDATGVYGRLNDLWKYDPVSGVWTWMHGSDVAGQNGVYGDRGAPATANTPGARSGAASAGWVDVNGRFWLYGGYGLPGAPAATMGYLEDVWRYDPATNQWAWMMGRNSVINAVCVPGTKGVVSPANYPGSRGIAPLVVDHDGNVWVHGGYGYVGASGNSRNDFWSLVAVLPPVPAQPGLYTTAEPAVCAGESNVTYTVPAVAGAASYDWEYSGTNASFTANTTTPTNSVSFAANATSGILSVRAVNAAGAGPWRDTTITVNALPTVNSTNTGSQSICAGDSLLLTATASSGVSYQWKHGATNVGTNSATYYAKTAGDYTVTVTNTTTNCSAASTPVTTLTITPLPNISINPTTVTICAGESATLTASGATTYSWSPSGGNNAAATVSPATTTTYTVTGTSSGCSTTVSRQVTVNDLPTVTSTNTGNQAICDGDSLLLTASGSSGVTYEWKNGTAPVGTNSNTYYAKAAGNYTVTVTNSNNCFATSAPSTNLTIDPLPVVSVTAAGPVEVCTGSTVMLTATQIPGVDYQWMDGNTLVGTNANTYTAGSTGSYKVVATFSSSGCSDSTAVVDVFVYSRPVISLEPGDTAFCDGSLVTLEVVSADTGLTYRWKNGSTTVPLANAYFLEVTETGDYTVVVGRGSVPGCEDTTNEVTVTVYPLPVVDITWDGEILHATPGYESYQWYNNGQGIIGETDSTYTPSSNSGYSVSVTDNNDCSSTSPVYNVMDLGMSVTDAGYLSAAVRIYPNPAKDVLHVDAPIAVTAVLSSIDGRLLQQQTNRHIMLNISNYADGVYLLRITDRNGLQIRNEKIVKQH